MTGVGVGVLTGVGVGVLTGVGVGVGCGTGVGVGSTTHSSTILPLSLDALFVYTNPSIKSEPTPSFKTMMYDFPHSSSVNGCNEESYDASIVPSNPTYPSLPGSPVT